MKPRLVVVGLAGLLAAVVFLPASGAVTYHADPGTADVLTGGVRQIEIQTPKGPAKVWTKRVGHNPRIKVLLLHGGPGATHEYLEACDSYFPNAEIEYYYYDQLGSAYSDQPDDPSLWELPRFVDEVEQVRQALGLDRDNFYLVGHSWGGLLAIEYALKYPGHLKGLVVSNMMASIPAYNAYAKGTLMPALPPEVLKEILAFEAAKDYENPRYMELLMGNFYTEHILRRPPDQWPEPLNRSFAKLNRKVYVPLQGPSEMGAVDCKLADWDRFADLKRITVPTLVVGARYDTMNPAYLEAMARELPQGHYLYCPNGSHMALYDDQKTWFNGVIHFIKDVDAGQAAR
jgi:proline iminopeptidase